MSQRSTVLADRLEQGARELIAFAGSLTDAEWKTRLPGDGRTVATIVHHVASVYPVEIHLAQTLAGGAPIAGVTTANVDDMNGKHAAENPLPDRHATLALLRRSSETASAAIRAMSDQDLDRGAPVSLYGDAPLTAQFVLEDHAVRHSFHHLAKIRTLLRR